MCFKKITLHQTAINKSNDLTQKWKTFSICGCRSSVTGTANHFIWPECTCLSTCLPACSLPMHTFTAHEHVLWGEWLWRKARRKGIGFFQLDTFQIWLSLPSFSKVAYPSFNLLPSIHLFCLNGQPTQCLVPQWSLIICYHKNELHVVTYTDLKFRKMRVLVAH